MDTCDFLLLASWGTGIGHCQGLNYDLTISPGSPILLGKSISATVINLTGGPADEVGWRFVCGNKGGYAVNVSQPELTKTFCANQVGDQTIGTVLRAGNESVVKSVPVVVDGPDVFSITAPSAASKSSGPDPLFALEHRFKLLKGTTPIGPCYTACCYERVITKMDGAWDPEPTTWEKTWCPGDDPSGFFFSSPDVFDTKVCVIDNFGPVPIGHVFREYKHRVGVGIKKCSGDIIMTTKLLHFQIIKASNTEITHSLVGEED